METNIWSVDPSSTDPGDEVKIQLFRRYQIKENGECSNMQHDDCSNIQPHILSLHTSLTPGWGQRSYHIL